MPVSLYPYQEDGARFLAGRARAGLFDKPGVGKSAQVVRALDLRGAGRGIVICPAAVREHWLGEFRQFEMQRRRVVKGVSIHDFIAWARGRFDTLVTSYEMAASWAPYIHALTEPLQFCVFDEGHFMKNDAAKRSVALLGPQADGAKGVLQWAEVGWWLTGTPIPNDPIDIFTFLRFTRAMPLHKPDFMKRYMHVRYQTYGTRQAVKPELQAELRQFIGVNSLCRTLAEIAPQLPPMRISSAWVDGDDDHVRDMLLQHPGLDSLIIEALTSGTKLSNLDAPHIATLRRIIGEAKALPYAHMLAGEIQGGLDKMVVLAHHRSVLQTVHDVLAKHGVRCGIVYGGVDEKERVAIQHSFAHDPGFKVLLANIRSGGAGLSLVASAHLDMLEGDWAPGNNYQALHRIRRITQIRSQLVRFIGLANSFDVQVNKIIADKTREIAALDNAGASDMERLLT